MEIMLDDDDDMEIVLDDEYAEGSGHGEDIMDEEDEMAIIDDCHDENLGQRQV